MAFIPTPNTVRVAIRGILFGQDIVNTLWFNIPAGGIDEALLGSLNSDVFDWVDTHFTAGISADYTLLDITSTSQDSPTAPSVTDPFTAIGQLAGAALPASNCITVKFSTPFRGRSGRGRNFVSAIRESDVVGNLINVPAAQIIVDAYNQLLLAPLLSAQAVWVVTSHYSEGAARSEGLNQAINSVSVVDYAIDSQRRRLTGRGS